MGHVATFDGARDLNFALVQDKLAACSKVVGEAFFPVMVEALAEALSVRWVMLCTLHPTDRNRAVTVAAWDNGPTDNFEYDLEHTPCAGIIGQGACCHPVNIRSLFPADTMLQDMGAESYVGTPLRTSSGEVMGLLAALDEKPIENADRACQVMELFSGRAAAELERLTTASDNERLGRIVEDSVSEVYIFNGDSYRFELVNRGARENLGYSMDEMRLLTPWDLKPNFSAEVFIEYVTPLRDGDVSNLRFETVHQRKDGSLYDVAVQLQYFAGVENRFYASITDITDRKRADDARAHLAAVVASSNRAIISTDLEGRVKSWNTGAEKIFGYPSQQMIGHQIQRLIPADRQGEEEGILARISAGELIKNYETIRVCNDGRHLDVSVNVSPIFDASGKIVGASKIAHDISDRIRAEARERLLMGEVNHRAKNMLALVQSIARQTAASDPTTFVQRFEERLHALAASHDVLLQSGWQDIPLGQLVRSQLAYFADAMGKRIHISGPELKITSAAAQAIGMALHELATNAVKYGALSNDHGSVAIDWRLAASESGAERFELCWLENGGPEVAAPTRRGFGSTVIERILKLSVNGEVDHAFHPTGLECRFNCPADRVLENANAAAPHATQANGANVLGVPKARRVLLVEDEILIGIEMSEILKDAGYEVLGPAASVAQAAEMIEQNECDVGVLDINLGGETSEPIAKILSEMGKPFLTVSSFDVAERPAIFADSPHFDKPLRPEQLIIGLSDLLETAT